MSDHVVVRPRAGTLEMRRFPTVSKAYAMYLEADHKYIYTCHEDLAERCNLDDLKWIHKVAMPNSPVPQWRSRTTAAKELWPILLMKSVYFDPWKKGVDKGRSRRQSDKISTRRYVIQYPNDWPEEQQRGLAAVPKQAQDIIYYLKERAIERKSPAWQESELKQVVIEMESEGRLRTRQDPWRIFQYYRAELIHHGFIRMEGKES